MPSKRKESLDALFRAISAVPVADVRRGGELPTRIPPSGLIILRDGIPGEPEVTLCPPIYEYRHRAEIEVFLQPAVGADAPAALDAVLVAIGEAIDADPTLGGVVLWAEPWAPDTEELALEGVAGIVAAVVPVELTYITTGPLA